MIALRESTALAEEFLAETIERHGIDRDESTIHDWRLSRKPSILTVLTTEHSQDPFRRGRTHVCRPATGPA